MRHRSNHWTDFELCRLRQLARDYSCRQIAGDIGRTQESVWRKARQLGLRVQPRPCNAPLPPKLRPVSVAECMSICASVPYALAELVVVRAWQRGVDLQTLRSDRRSKELVAFRREIAVEAFRESFAYAAIGRALNRDHTTIIHHVQSALAA